jgi:hypothetical protein
MAALNEERTGEVNVSKAADDGGGETVDKIFNGRIRRRADAGHGPEFELLLRAVPSVSIPETRRRARCDANGSALGTRAVIHGGHVTTNRKGKGRKRPCCDLWWKRAGWWPCWVAAGVGTWGLHAYPVRTDDVFLALVEARKPFVFQVLAYIYATLWFTTPFFATSLVTSVLATDHRAQCVPRCRSPRWHSRT